MRVYPAAVFCKVSLFVAASLALILGLRQTVSAQPATTQSSALPANLPNPLICDDGTPVTSPDMWRERRRPELLNLLTHQEYGRMPARPEAMRFEVFDTDVKALDGRATRKQVAAYFDGKPDGPRMDLLIYLPNKARRPVPVIFGLNFWGNQSVISDPAIRLPVTYMDGPTSGSRQYLDLSGVKENRATEATRGIDAGRWAIEQILARGYGFATAYRNDIAVDLPETDAQPTGVRASYPQLQVGDDNFGTLAAWAWGFSRGMDYLVTDKDVDANRVAIFGWSRLGKAAIWAGATDERFAAVISSESAAGGAKLFHHKLGEDIHRLVTVFPHWYCRAFRSYDGQDTTMAFDQNFALALIAPRPLYVASSQGSGSFDPVGEFLGAKSVNPVYELLGVTGLRTDEMPALDQPVIGRISYHRRTGKHDVTAFDWEQYLKFCDQYLHN
jgi:hypothetical protein